jgi:hypothetical protein
MGICGLCTTRDKQVSSSNDNDNSKNDETRFESLKERIKKQSNKIHSQFKENVEEIMNSELFFLTEKLKLILSEFSDIVTRKIMNRNVDLTEEDFLEMEKFIANLEVINSNLKSNKKEKEYSTILERYKKIIEKVKKISNEVIENSDDEFEIKEQNENDKNEKINAKTK